MNSHLLYMIVCRVDKEGINCHYFSGKMAKKRLYVKK